MATQSSVTGVFDATVKAFAADVVEALPTVLTGILFLVLAGAGVVVFMRLFRAGLRRTLPGAEPVYRQFATRIVGLFLWFGVALAFLSIVGLEGIAAALGTASGFLALGVAYALSGMLADAVAGIYLLRDPDFNPGDEVVVGDMAGVVETIELRKTRFTVDGDTVVRGNAEIEKRWTKRGPPAD
ncbi:MAG: mechanosensitive ion channel [Halobacteriales archaeon]|nr:mechanosensitive ion channel [Halobacteriales archaeon]